MNCASDNIPLSTADGHQCFVCGAAMLPYFRKHFNRMGLGDVDYIRCVGCGFVQSQTHQALSETQWAQLNMDFHQHHYGTRGIGSDSGVPYGAQAAAIEQLFLAGVLPFENPWVDYACGQGHLAEELQKRKITIANYDQYPPPDAQDYLVEAQMQPGRFDFVVNSAMFEHVLTRRPLDKTIALIAHGGVFALHTMISEVVPNNPDWSYFDAEVHTAFFTNKAMQLLFKQWGFKACLYHLPSMLWFFLPRPIEALPIAAQQLLGTPDWIAKNDFADYFKFLMIDGVWVPMEKIPPEQRTMLMRFP